MIVALVVVLSARDGDGFMLSVK